MSFSVDFVEPAHFGEKRWWRPARTGSAWFYHTPAPARPPSFLRDYSTVDPQIRRLVMWLHSRGLPTLPSCSGHWPKKKWASRCYDELAQDAEKIRYGGEYMIDVETGVRALHQDPYWELPWGDWAHFLSDMREHDGHGYLCFWLPASNVIWKYLEDLKSLPGVHVRVVPHAHRLCLEISVWTASEISQGNAWHSVECFLRRLG
jgi:hypothetical protein